MTPPLPSPAPSADEAPEDGIAAPPPTEAGGLHVLRGPSDAAAVLSPLRRRIVEALMEPDSATGVARRLGLPRQRINYHVRTLEKEGLLRAVGTRARGGCTERLVQAVARHYLIAPQALGDLAADPDAVRDRFSSSYLMAVAGAAIGDLSALQEAEGVDVRLPTLTLQTEVRFASAAARKAFAEELATTVAALIKKHHDPGSAGRPFRVFLGAYPAPAVAAPTEDDDR